MKSTRYTRLLENKNEILCEKACLSSDINIRSAFSIRTVFSGFESYEIGHRKINLYPGNFLVINEGSIYSRSINSTVPVTGFSISFDSDYMARFVRWLESQKRADYLIPYKSELNSTLIVVDSIYPLSGDMECNIMHLKSHTDKGSIDPFMVNQYLHHVLLDYAAIYHRELLNKALGLTIGVKMATKLDIVRRIAMAKDFIISHHERNITLEDIAGIACLSVSHLIRIYRLVFKKSPYQYLTQVRLERARYYLANTGISIQEIVGLVGFENPSSFIRLFRTAYNVTPGAFRQQLLDRVA